MVLRSPVKTLVAIEAFICFAPLAFLLFLGVVMAPFQVYVAFTKPLDWEAAVTFVGQVVCGLAGFVTLVYVLASLFNERDSVQKPLLVCIGVALGALGLMPFILDVSFPSNLFGLLPLAVTAHVVFLARRMLFTSWSDGLKKGAIAVAIALAMWTVPLMDPSRTSGDMLREQQVLWEQRAPDRYAFTIQTSGDAPREALFPKRVRVGGRKVISVTYAWDNKDHKAGDPAPSDGLWTIDRAFQELRAAAERGWKVNATFDERRGFIAEARAFPDDGENTGWGVEVRDFREELISSD